MKTQSPDTSAEMEKIQFELMAQAGVAGRLKRMRALSASGIALSRRALARRHPEWSEQEVLLRWVELHYGEAVASQVRRCIGNE